MTMVKGFLRRSKSGKVTMVRAHNRSDKLKEKMKRRKNLFIVSNTKLKEGTIAIERTRTKATKSAKELKQETGKKVFIKKFTSRGKELF